MLPAGWSGDGCITVPGRGAEGVGGWVLIATFCEAGDVQPNVFVTVKLNIPAGRPETDKLVPLPLVATPPGVLVIVQFPDAGRPLNATAPVATVHDGCVMVPITGADGVTG